MFHFIMWDYMYTKSYYESDFLKASIGDLSSTLIAMSI
jgi:hypothetical protein